MVTQNEHDAKRLVNYLKSHNYGRATFLPISAVKPKFIGDSYMGLLNRAGCLGVASELIQFDKNLKRKSSILS